MTDQQNNQTVFGEGPSAEFSLQRIYLKDLSFESPRSPNLFREQYRPKVNLELNSRHSLVDENTYEVVLNLTVTARNEQDETLFMTEVQQAGVFVITGMKEEALKQALGSYCPSLLFPYARETIDNVVTKGSLPALMLAPVNFDAIYAKLKQHEVAQTSH